MPITEHSDSRGGTRPQEPPRAVADAAAREVDGLPLMVPLAALQAVEARLTRAARAFYGDGRRSALREAFDGWKNDIEPARAAIARATATAEGDEHDSVAHKMN